MVTAIVNNPGIAAGMVLDWTGARTFKVPKPSGVITRGDVLCRDVSTSPDSYTKKTAAAFLEGPFVMALETVVSGATSISIVEGGVWCTTADGDMEPGFDAGMSSSTDGQVVALPELDTTATPTETTIERAVKYYRMKVGKCEGFADSYNTGAVVKAVDGDLVAINANKGY